MRLWLSKILEYICYPIVPQRYTSLYRDEYYSPQDICDYHVEKGYYIPILPCFRWKSYK